MLTVRLRGPSPYGQPRCTCPDLFDFQFKRGKDKRTECLILLNTRFWELLCDFQWGCWPIWIIAPIESFRMLKKRPRKVRWPGKPLKSIPSQCVQYKLKTHGTLVEYLPNQAQYDDGRYFKIRPSCLLNSSIMDPGWILYYILLYYPSSNGHLQLLGGLLRMIYLCTVKNDESLNWLKSAKK